jgi:hypothetical protein
VLLLLGAWPLSCVGVSRAPEAPPNVILISSTRSGPITSGCSDIDAILRSRWTEDVWQKCEGLPLRPAELDRDEIEKLRALGYMN